MKFFSNDAKENTDGSDYDRDNSDRDRSDLVTSDPVSVPQQRAGSPWSDAPAGETEAAPATGGVDTETDAELADRERRDGSDEDRLATDDRLEAPAQPETDEEHVHEGAHRDDFFGESPAAASTTDAHAVDSTSDPVDTDPVGTDTDSVDKDEAIKDEGTFDSPEAVEPATGEPLAETDSHPDSDSDSDADADADADSHSGFGSEKDEVEATPAVVEPIPLPAAETSTDPVFADPGVVDSTDADQAVPVVAAVPVAAAGTPGSAPAPELDKLFADDDSYADRFREIQFRFVDSPKEATAEAAALVGEAVDKLTAALKSQRDSLSGGDTDDTERLRVELRGYRDLMNRLLAL